MSFRKSFRFVFALALLGAVLAGCGKSPEKSADAAKPAAPGKTQKTSDDPGKKVESSTPATQTAAPAPKAKEFTLSADGRTLLKYTGKGTDFRVPDGVTAIGEGAFAECQTLQRVTLPQGLTTIGNEAFSGCVNLEEAAIPAGVAAIGESAFARCNFKNVKFPQSVSSIGPNAFSGCAALDLVKEDLPPRSAVIGEKAFSGCPCERLVKECFPSYLR